MSWDFVDDIMDLKNMEKIIQDDNPSKSAAAVVDNTASPSSPLQALRPTSFVALHPSCQNCGRAWNARFRSGPQGPRTLCNACGLKWYRTKCCVQQIQPPAEHLKQTVVRAMHYQQCIGVLIELQNNLSLFVPQCPIILQAHLQRQMQVNACIIAEYQQQLDWLLSHV